jgi:DNA-directed RNA polymerase specialized sigma24 family protein
VYWRDARSRSKEADVDDKNDVSLEKQLSAGTRYFERISNLLALLLVTGKPQPEQISLLSAAGYSPSEIARILDTTSNTVSVTLSQRRRGKSRRKKH